MMSNIDRSKLPRHKLEELKRKEDAVLTKEVYQEFVATFEDSSKVGKAFVRGEVVNADESIQKQAALGSKPKLYKPTPTLWKPPSAESGAKVKSENERSDKQRLLPVSGFGKAVLPENRGVSSPSESILDQAKRTAQEKAKKIMEEAMKSRPPKQQSIPVTKKKPEPQKPKSNLEAFKDELKRMQEERTERRKIRQQLKDQLGITDPETADKIAGLNDPYANTYESDPNTTNVFLSNLSPQITEEDICRIFGKYGPLASVKVMWARTDEEKARGYLCGFVAYMTRLDGERAMSGERGTVLYDFEMKMGWGKSVNIPAYPVYVPPAMMELTLPPPASGLPFNAQPREKDREAYEWPLPPPGAPPPPLDSDQRIAWDKGDSPSKWSVKKFRMFKDGSIWQPPPVNFYAQGMPSELYVERRSHKTKSSSSNKPQHSGTHSEDSQSEREANNGAAVADHHSDREREREVRRERRRSRSRSAGRSSPSSSRRASPGPSVARKGQLSHSQRDRFEDMLRQLTPERSSIAEAMLYCVKHADAAEEIVDCICESVSIPETPLSKKMARLYLVADILANCSAKVPNVSYFRKALWKKLEVIFENIAKAYKSISARLKAEQFKAPNEVCDGASGTFSEEPDSGSALQIQASLVAADYEEDFDGVPLDALHASLTAAHSTTATATKTPGPEKTNTAQGGFVRSKWEEVEPELVEQQAMTTSKWDILERREGKVEANIALDSKPFLTDYRDESNDEEDIDGMPLDDDSEMLPPGHLVKSLSEGQQKISAEIDEEKRAKLREIEVEVMKFQDQLESSRLPSKNHDAQVEAYRQKLMRKMEEQGSQLRKEKRKKPSDEKSSSQSHGVYSRSPSPHANHKKSKRSRRSRSRSRSPKKHKKHHKKEKQSIFEEDE